MNRALRSSPAAASPPARSRSSRLPVAWLRMCSSSPMLTPCAASEKTSIGPSAASTRDSDGPRWSRKKRSRSIAGSPPTPNQSVSPGPSLSVENARRSDAGSSVTQTAIDGEQIPVIGPTCRCSVPDLSVTWPPDSRSRALSRSDAQPFEQNRRDHRPPLRITDALPRDRRPRVQEHAVVETIDHVARAGDVDRLRLAAFDRVERRSRWRRGPPGQTGPTARSARQSHPRHRPPADASRPKSPARPGRPAPPRTAAARC